MDGGGANLHYAMEHFLKIYVGSKKQYSAQNKSSFAHCVCTPMLHSSLARGLCELFVFSQLIPRRLFDPSCYYIIYNSFPKIQSGYLCKPTDNTFGVEFTAFKLRDAGSGATLFEVVSYYGSIASDKRWEGCLLVLEKNFANSTTVLALQKSYEGSIYADERQRDDPIAFPSCTLKQAKPDDAPADVPDDSDDSGRFVQYQFPPAFLQLRQVGAT